MNLKQAYDEAMAKLAEGPMFVPAVIIKRDNMNNAEQWISLDDRLPTEADLPVWYANIEKQQVWGAYYAFEGKEHRRQGQYDATHWKHAKADIPAPPPRAKTLAEMDAQACSEYLERNGYKLALSSPWHAALAYERAEVAKILAVIDQPCSQSYGVAGRINDVVSKLRARVKGGAS